MSPRLIPEFDVLALDASLEFDVAEIGFSIVYDRPEERFVYLDLEGAHLMLEEASGAGRRFHAEPLERPLGRAMNLQIQVTNVDAIYANLEAARNRISVELEESWYRRGSEENGNRQFVVADPDGYLLRFYAHLGRRPTAQPPLGA
jgi:catechol 2,3-dioxygenase-like lactoylglutathione lyase family enzyme